jgi:homoserine O-succinyltransferase
MPLNIPDKLPAIEILQSENIFVINETRAAHQDIRPLRVVILNLMPVKITTETDLLRLLSNTPLQIEIDFLKIRDHEHRHTPAAHMKTFYKTFDQIKNRKYDGMIITGAPVEHLSFEEVTYWEEMKEIMDWSVTHSTSTLFICWASQAGLYHFYGIPKYPLGKKISGIFKHRVSDNKMPIFRGFDDEYDVPHSRYTEIKAEDIARVPELEIISASYESGVNMVMAKKGRQFFITGHHEYSRETLDIEYKRDLAKKLPVDIPANYYPDNDPKNQPVMKWRSAANLLFANWLNYYVYQETPYNPDEIT